MRTVFSLLFLGAAMLLWTGVEAGDKKKEGKAVTLKGMITCGKCDLNVDKACATVIVVKKDKNDVVYYFDSASHKKYHDDICTAGKKGQVTGVVSKEGKKNIITVKELKYE